MLKVVLPVLVFILSSMLCFGQVDNYKSINIQGQLNTSLTETSFEFLVLSISDDTLYRERHITVPLTSEGEFTLSFGNGEFLAGSISEFYLLDWHDVNKIQLYHTGDSRYLQGEYTLFAVPYALHSLSVDTKPTVGELNDVLPGDLSEETYIKFDGVNYFFNVHVYSDTVLFAWISDITDYADTADFAFNNEFADSALYAYTADSSNYTFATNSVNYADSVKYVDSSETVFYSSGNWSIFGNEFLVDTNFLGSILEEDLILNTNSNQRLFFGTSGEVHNNFSGEGFRMNVAARGALFTPNTNPGDSLIDGPYIYFDGATHSFHGGRNDGEIDTLKGIYSFSFGENVGTNGMYSTVFGKNTYGDTSYFSGVTPYSAISSFALGRNCRVTHMGVAIGDSAIANYYRNVAIGKNVISTDQSAGVAIGNNVIVKGATSWAMGNNLTATGNFATVLGRNASTLTRKGGWIYGDFSATDTVVSLADNQFIARGAGGFIFYSSGDLSMGVELLPGAGSWSMISDRNKKKNILTLNPLDFSAQFNDLPVFSWNYIGQSTLHIGPMAQDVYHLFGVGEKPYYINMIDADGIVFLGIKYLKIKVDELPASEDIDSLEDEIKKEQEAQAELERRINELYEKLDTH